ncbi:MAG: 16S rRNA (adenine(1518)-N(6)/adenine(1519)-N(6))-dimethyltransferase RsmA [Bdellovibrionales bacterium]|nr:16S rRNA (adenine(1518)-N(6)/adenine(1519)-N(6))-dimethyltransferase RsmA [Bdellovibrionales bacterium]
MSELTQQTKNRMIELGIRPQKSLGQNFLINEHVVSKIITEVILKNSPSIIEIGPGLGALTEGLKNLNRINLQVIELDAQLARFWRQQGLHVIENDALKLDWSRLNLNCDTTLVSNLPYQISTHLVVDRCFGPSQIKFMILMFQKEVAERILAKPRSKSYGFLSIISQSHWKITKLIDVDPGSFWPAPKISSRVLVFEKMEPPFPGLEKPFFNFLKLAFAQRRKFLSKNLMALSSPKQLTLQQIGLWLESIGENQKARAEELSVPQFQKLFQIYRETLKGG